MYATFPTTIKKLEIIFVEVTACCDNQLGKWGLGKWEVHLGSWEDLGKDEMPGRIPVADPVLCRRHGHD